MIKINLNGLYNRVEVVTLFDPFTENFTILHHSKAFTILAQNLFILLLCIILLQGTIMNPFSLSAFLSQLSPYNRAPVDS